LVAFDIFVYVSPLIFLHRLLKHLQSLCSNTRQGITNWDSLPSIKPAYNLTQLSFAGHWPAQQQSYWCICQGSYSTWKPSM